MDRLCPPEHTLERFRADATALGLDGTFAVAVSGGPDSLALLLLAAGSFRGRVEATTVDHGLRAASADEAAFVAGICRALGVPHEILPANVDIARASRQRAAREARYAAIDGWMARRSLRTIATAHHVEDQAETLLMRLLRGSGVGGLAGVRRCSPLPVHGSSRLVIRPLLGWRRDELRAIIDEAGITPVDDPSNRDPAFDRVRVRQQLAETSWLGSDALAASASALADADDALAWATRNLWSERVRSISGKLEFDPEGIPAELRRRILLRILDELGEATSTPRGDEIGRLLESLADGRTGTLAGVQCTGGEVWLFGRAPARRRSR